MTRATAEIPEAWPALLTREQLRAYLGGICEKTRAKICPVAPLNMGANILLYNKRKVDAWIDTIPLRLPHARNDQQGAVPDDAEPLAANDRPASAVERARRRAGSR